MKRDTRKRCIGFSPAPPIYSGHIFPEKYIAINKKLEADYCRSKRQDPSSHVSPACRTERYIFYIISPRLPESQPAEISTPPPLPHTHTKITMYDNYSNEKIPSFFSNVSPFFASSMGNTNEVLAVWKQKPHL